MKDGIVDGGGNHAVKCYNPFAKRARAITDLPLLYYLSGDGQEAPPGSPLPYPLVVGVATRRGKTERRKVRFKIEEGEGWLLDGQGNRFREFSIPFEDDKRLAECRWELGMEIPDQQVKAVLLDAHNNEISLPLYFGAILDRPHLYYVGGGGQQGRPGSFLHFPLVTGVAIGKMQIKGAKVRFRILNGKGRLRDADGNELEQVDLETNENGLVGCLWRLGGEGDQQVEAVLLDADGEETNLRLAFNASFAVAPQIMPANTGTIILYNPETTEFGPFDHWVENIETPPAILLGLVNQSRDEEKEGYLRPKDVPPAQAKRVLDFLNSAKTPEEITARARVSIRIALRILKERERLGRYESLGQVDKVYQVGPERFTEIVRALTELAGIVQPCKYMEDYGLYSFGEGQPRFKVKDVGLKRFSIKLEEPVEKTLTLRWWAIPAQEQEPQEAIESEPVVLATPYDALVLDPADCLDPNSWEIFNNIGEGLLKYKPGTTELEPGIAESYTVNLDGREYTFSLREGLYFTDGMPLDAGAVKHSIDRVKSLYGGSSAFVSNFVESVEVVDDYTVKFVLKEPVPYFPALAATVPYFPVSPKTYPANKIVESTVGHHGPYKIKEWIEGSHLTLETNPDYYGSPPRSQLFIFVIITSGDAMLFALKRGEFDMAWRVPENTIEQILQYSDLKEKFVVQESPEPTTGMPNIPFLQERFYTVFKRNVKGVVLDPKLIIRYYLIYKEQEPQ